MKLDSKIHTCLWFDGDAVEAARFYTSLFPDSDLISISPISSGPASGQALVEFAIAGRRFTAVDGGPMYRFSPAISFVINCESQVEIDRYWKELTNGGIGQPCGWLRDRFGVSWQVVPDCLGELMGRNPERVTEVLLGMEKIEIAPLRAAAGLSE